MPFIILLVVLLIVWKVVGGKRKKEKEEQLARQTAAAAAQKAADRQARLVDGEPVECTEVPEKESCDTAVTGPNGKTYYAPYSNKYKKFLGHWDPVYRLVAAEDYAQSRYESFVKGNTAFYPSTKRELVDCIVFAAESYAYGTAGTTDLYQSERSLLRRLEDRAHALQDDGYLLNPVVPMDVEKAIRYYKMLDDMLLNHQDRLADIGDSHLYTMMRAWAELGHLYGYLQNEKESRRYYDMGFRGTANDELLQLDVLHAMMAGYPRDPAPYANMLTAMLADWVQGGSPLAMLAGGLEYKSYTGLDQQRLAESPQAAVGVYTEGMEKGDAYCTYMLGRCALYGYGMAQDTDRGWQLLEQAAGGSSVSAAALLVKLCAGDDKKQAHYQAVLDTILSAAEGVQA